MYDFFGKWQISYPVPSHPPSKEPFCPQEHEGNLPEGWMNLELPGVKHKAVYSDGENRNAAAPEHRHNSALPSEVL